MTGDSNDMALVREFAETRSESVFAELVQRHIGLVHSTALRKTGEPHLAQEVAQTVFIVLARKAAALSPQTILPVWLHRTTLYVTADVLKTQRRRQIREHKAFMQSQLSGPSGSDEADGAWSQLAPILDDALGELAEPDRAAVVLRYFQDKPARDIAAALHIGEEAAQKRVTRALEKLRTIFARRGVALSTAALGSAIAANSVSATPAGMVATISTVAVAATTSGSILTATTAIAMTTLHKTVVASLLAVTASVGVYEARQAALARSEARALQEQQAPLADQIAQLQKERDDATNRLAALAADVSDANANNADLLRLRGEVAALRNQLAASVATATPTPTRAASLQSIASASTPGDDVPMQLAIAIGQGDSTALGKLNDYSQGQHAFFNTNSAGLTNEQFAAVSQQSFAGLHAAFKSLADQAANGNVYARQAIDKAATMSALKGVAVKALGELAGRGDQHALEMLLNPAQHGLLLSSTVGALGPSADAGNERAIAALVAVLADEKHKPLWYMASQGLQRAAESGNPTAQAALKARQQP
jgi:RNA polymerase sigma factor (sigma-70 family)